MTAGQERSQAYAVTIVAAEANLRGAPAKARQVLNTFNVPDGSQYLLVGSDCESALLHDDRMNLAQFVGDSEAESVLTTATIGNRHGFRITVSQEIPADAAYAAARPAEAKAPARSPCPRSSSCPAPRACHSRYVRATRRPGTTGACAGGRLRAVRLCLPHNPGRWPGTG